MQLIGLNDAWVTFFVHEMTHKVYKQSNDIGKRLTTPLC
jgi:hypothetical protein